MLWYLKLQEEVVSYVFFCSGNNILADMSQLCNLQDLSGGLELLSLSNSLCSNLQRLFALLSTA